MIQRLPPLGAMDKRHSIPFAQSPPGMPERAPGVRGGMSPVWPHGEDDALYCDSGLKCELRSEGKQLRIYLLRH